MFFFRAGFLVNFPCYELRRMYHILRTNIPVCQIGQNSDNCPLLLWRRHMCRTIVPICFDDVICVWQLSPFALMTSYVRTIVPFCFDDVICVWQFSPFAMITSYVSDNCPLLLWWRLMCRTIVPFCFDDVICVGQLSPLWTGYCKSSEKCLGEIR